MASTNSVKLLIGGTYRVSGAAENATAKKICSIDADNWEDWLWCGIYRSNSEGILQEEVVHMPEGARERQRSIRNGNSDQPMGSLHAAPLPVHVGNATVYTWRAVDLNSVFLILSQKI
ncbi:hypothetical protein Ancab_035008 [Ancistrocladus abbreviatus]